MHRPKLTLTLPSLGTYFRPLSLRSHIHVYIKPAVFVLTLSGSTIVTVTTCNSTFDTRLDVARMLEEGRTEAVAANDDHGGMCTGQNAAAGDSYIRRAALDAGAYAIRVRGWAGSAGTFRLSLRCWNDTLPTVDEVLAAAPSVACGATLSGATIRNGHSLVGNESPEQFFRFTVDPAAPAAAVTLSTCGSVLDTLLRVGSVGEDGSVNTMLAINDNHAGEVPSACGDEASYIAALLPPGDYAIIVEANSGPLAASTFGEFTLTVECPECANSPQLCASSATTGAPGCEAAPSHEGCADGEYCGEGRQCYACSQCAVFNEQGCTERCAGFTNAPALSSTSPFGAGCANHEECVVGGSYCDMYGQPRRHFWTSSHVLSSPCAAPHAPCDVLKKRTLLWCAY